MRLIIKLLIILLIQFPGSSFAGKYNSIMDIGDPMPAFKNLPSISGKDISSSDISEDVIVLISLANHCPWVKGMDKDLVQLASSFEDQSVRFIGLSVNHRDDDRLPAMKVHAEKNGYSFDYIYDESQDLGRKLGATRTPEYFVFNKQRALMYTGALYNSPAKINKDGSVNHINGDPTEFYVRDAISSLLNNDEIKVKETRAHGCTVKYAQ